jgi:hypothetical protein
MNNLEASSKNLVLGVVKGYEFEQIKPFLLSLKNTGYKGDVCLFISKLSPKTHETLKQFSHQNIIDKTYGFKLTLYPFKMTPGISIPYIIKNGKLIYRELSLYHLLDIYPFNRVHLLLINTLTSFLTSLNHQPKYIIKANLLKTHLSIISIRFFMYYLYLSEYGKDYDKVLLTDIRDVLFQRDPFEFDFPNGLCCFLEDVSLRNCEYTSSWLRRAFGEYIIDEIGDRKVSCAGTTMGTRSAIMSYLETLIDYTLKSKLQRFGTDQAVHNYILYKDLVKGVKFYKNCDGPVFTMSYSKEENLQFDNQGFLLNLDGSIINILHQYDRKSIDARRKMIVYQNSECTN